MTTQLNHTETNIFEGAYYVLNSDNKIELHLNGKDHYKKLPEEVKTHGKENRSSNVRTRSQTN